MIASPFGEPELFKTTALPREFCLILNKFLYSEAEAINRKVRIIIRFKEKEHLYMLLTNLT